MARNYVCGCVVKNKKGTHKTQTTTKKATQKHEHEQEHKDKRQGMKEKDVKQKCLVA